MAEVLAETYAGNNSPENTFTINKPSGTTTGDTLIAAINRQGNSGAAFLTLPTDWVLIAPLSRSGTSGNDACIELFRLEVTGDHSGLTDWTWTLNVGVTSRWQGWIGRYDGIDLSSPIDGAVVSTNGGGVVASACNVLAHTTAADDSVRIAVCGGNDPNDTTTWTFTEPSGWEEIHDGNTVLAVRRSLGIAELVAAAGSTTATTFTPSVDVRYATQVIALKVDGAAEPGAPTVSAGADVFNHPVNTEFTRTATVTPGTGSIVSTVWTVQSGPDDVGSTQESDASLAWTPDTAGTYVLRCTATDDTPLSAYDEISVEVVDEVGGSGAQTHGANPSLSFTVGPLDKPSGTTDGDVLIAAFSTVGSSGDWTAPADWVEVSYRRDGTSNASGHVRVFKLAVTGAHSGITSWSWTTSKNTMWSGWMGLYTDVDPAAIVDVSNGVDSDDANGVAATATTFPVASVTTTFDNDRVLVFAAGNEATATTHTFTPPSGFTERFDANTLYATRTALAVAETTQAVAGATPTGDFTCTHSVRWATLTVALKLTGAGSSNTPPSVSAGADVFGHQRDTLFTRTGSAIDSDGTITDTRWTVLQGPAYVGNILSTSPALSWTPDVAGTFTLRFSATDDEDAQVSDNMTLQVVVPPGGSGMYAKSDDGVWIQTPGFSTYSDGDWHAVE